MDSSDQHVQTYSTEIVTSDYLDIIYFAGRLVIIMVRVIKSPEDTMVLNFTRTLPSVHEEKH